MTPMGRSKSIKISYDIFDSPLWEEKRVYSRFEAYIDMLVFGRRNLSFRSLADRWGWSLGKTQRFLRFLMGVKTLSDTLTDTLSDTPKPLCTEGFQEVGDTPTDTLSDTARKETPPVPLKKETPPPPPIEINPPISPKEKNGTPSYTPPYDFEEWWDLYDKKVERAKCEAKWKKLSTAEKRACIAATPVYVASTPDKQYRKNPQTYLNNKSWNDEIINYGTDNSKEQQRRQRLIEAADLFAEYAGAGK